MLLAQLQVRRSGNSVQEVFPAAPWYLSRVTKAELHRLVDELPEEAVHAVGRLLKRSAADPRLKVLDAAPWDDEPYTDKERAEDSKALTTPGIPLEQVRLELLG